MKIEHFGMNVPDPVGMAKWYVEHLGMRIVTESGEPPYGHFLADRHKPGIDFTDSTERIPANERFADAFAACFYKAGYGAFRFCRFHDLEFYII